MVEAESCSEQVAQTVRAGVRVFDAQIARGSDGVLKVGVHVRYDSSTFGPEDLILTGISARRSGVCNGPERLRCRL